MENIKTALCLVLIVSLVMALAACGSVDISGKYDLVSMESDGEKIAADDLKALLGENLEMYLELKSDGTGVLNMMGEAAEMVYKDGMIWAVGTETEKIPFTVEEGTLTMTQNGETLIFQK